MSLEEIFDAILVFLERLFKIIAAFVAGLEEVED